MKKFSLLTIVVLILTLLPINAFAAEPAELDLRVYNRTGDPVSVRLTTGDEAPIYLEFPDGVSEVTLTEGIYEYYIITSCGTQVGLWNVNVVKELLIKCTGAVPEVSLQRACPDNFYLHYYYLPDYDITWAFPYDSWNGPDWLEMVYADPDLKIVDSGVDCWSNKDQYGWW